MKHPKGPYVVLVLDADGRMLLNILTPTIELKQGRTVEDLPFLSFQDWLNNLVPSQGVTEPKTILVIRPTRIETPNLVGTIE